MDRPIPAPSPDPVDAYRSGLDITLIRESLRLTPEQRFLRLTDLVRFAEELRAAGRRLRGEAIVPTDQP